MAKPLQFIASVFRTLFIERRLPWKLQRFITLTKINGLHSIVTYIKFTIKKPKYRIVVSSIYFGGIGGTEKNLMSLVSSMDDCLFYIHADNINSEGFVPPTNNYFVNMLIPSEHDYDLYFYYAGGGYADYLGDTYNFKTKMIITNANDVRPLEDRFNHILIQSENYSDFFDQHEKRLQAFPNVPITFPKEEKTTDLPENYFITVFNPFDGKQKGYDIFLKAADHSSLPIVWCFNNKTNVKHDTLPEHPNIIRMPNLTQEELLYAYKNSRALVSFSNYESFGWVLAEAFYCGIPIISRKTGFLDYVFEQEGIEIYNNEQELFSLLSTTNHPDPKYSYKLFEANSYAKVIDRIVNNANHT